MPAAGCCFLDLAPDSDLPLITEHVIVPLELGSLPWFPGGTIADAVGREGFEQISGAMDDTCGKRDHDAAGRTPR